MLHNDEIVCYCFGFTRNDIERDFTAHGKSTIMEGIAAEKKSGGCHCSDQNPKGR